VHDLYLQARKGIMRSPYTDLSAALVNIPSDSSPELGEWFNHPRRACMEAWFYFPEGLAPDVALVVDIESREGGEKYNYNTLPRAAWMFLVYFYPSGKGHVFSGSETNIRGIGVTARENLRDIDHYFFDIGTVLQPNTWYKLGLEVDFGKLKFVGFSVEGKGVKKHVDLSKYNVSLPLRVPVPLPIQIIEYYVGADKPGCQPGRTVVYVDDVIGKIETPEGYKTIFEDGFEKQSDLFLGLRYTNPLFHTLDPETLIALWMKHMRSHAAQWHLERSNGKALIGKAPAYPVRHGSQALILDTSTLITEDPLIKKEARRRWKLINR